jgi:hypothetical protein
VTTLNIELLDTLKKAGVDDETARAAAKAVLGIEAKEQLAIKADLAELKAEIQAMLNRQLQVMMGMMIALTGIFAAIVKHF